MTGKIIGALLVMAGLLLIVYWEHAKKIAVAVGGMATQIQGPSDKKKVFWTWVGVIAGVAILWWLYSTNPTVTQTSTLARENWAVVIVSAGLIIWALVHFAKAKTETAFSWVAILVIAIWVAGPVSTLVVNGSAPDVTCADPRGDETKHCLINTTWTRALSGATAGPSSYGKQLCFTPDEGVEFKRWSNGSGTFWQFKAKKDIARLSYRFMSSCPTTGILPE